jgi:hypothetical protein
MSTRRKINIEKESLVNSLKNNSINFDIEDAIPKPWMISTKSANNIIRYGPNTVIYYNYRTGKYYVYNKDSHTLLLYTSTGGGKTRRLHSVKTSRHTR